MLPALTASRGRLPGRRVALGACAVVLGVVAVGTQLATTASSAPARSESIAEELRPSSWAIEIPAAWLAAPLRSVRPGDSLDILAVRGGDRGYAIPVAYAVTVMSVDERALVLEVDQDDAIAIANARGASLLLVPLLRSTR